MKIINKIQFSITKKLNRSNERTTNAIKNILASFIIKGISILVSLLLVPLTINYVNPTQYGIWLTLSSIVAWFSFFDIGFGNGLRNRFAEAKATGDYKKAKGYVSTTYVCLGVIFTVIWILFFCINFFVDWSVILNAPVQMAKELSQVAIIVFSFFCMQIVLKTINTILIANQKPAKSAFFDMLGQVFALLIIFILTKTTSGSLLYIALALGFSPVLIMLISSFWFYTHDYKKFTPSIHLFEKNTAKDILNLGSKFFLVQITALLLFQTNSLIIAHVCGNIYVTEFNIAYKYIGIINMVFTIIVAPYWSATTEAYKHKDFQWIHKNIKFLNYVWGWVLIFGIILVVIAKSVYCIWLGDSIEANYLLLTLMLLYYMVYMRWTLYGNFINGIGKVSLQLYITLIEVIVHIPLTIFLSYQYGLNGAVLSMTITSLVNVIWPPIQIKKILCGTEKGIWVK
jgi:O-antigen/teichoic acid export membrane protein